jgi:hypothetical protein
VPVVEAEVVKLGPEELPHLSSAIGAIKDHAAQFKARADLRSVQVKKVGDAMLFAPEVSAAITASQGDATSLREIVRANTVLKMSLDAANIPVFAILAVTVTDSGGVIVYVRDTGGA